MGISPWATPQGLVACSPPQLWAAERGVVSHSALCRVWHRFKAYLEMWTHLHISLHEVVYYQLPHAAV